VAATADMASNRVSLNFMNPPWRNSKRVVERFWMTIRTE